MKKFIGSFCMLTLLIFVANKSSVESNSKKLEADVKVKLEPVDDDVVMGECSSLPN